MQKMWCTGLLSLVLLISWSSMGEARLIGLGGGALIDLTGALGLDSPVMPLARLSVGLAFLGADVDVWFLSSSMQLVPALAIRLRALLVAVIEFYAAIAPVSFQIAPTAQIVSQTMIRWGVNAGFGFVSIFSELVLLAQWTIPIVWQGPGLGVGVQVGF